MFSMKCTGAVSGTFLGAGKVCSVHCTVYSVLPATGDDLAVEKDKSNLSFNFKIFFLTNSPSVYLQDSLRLYVFDNKKREPTF